MDHDSQLTAKTRNPVDQFSRPSRVRAPWLFKEKGTETLLLQVAEVWLWKALPLHERQAFSSCSKGMQRLDSCNVNMRNLAEVRGSFIWHVEVPTPYPALILNRPEVSLGKGNICFRPRVGVRI